MDSIYFDLDTILDTRLATIARYDQALATKVLEGPYHERDMDQFPGLTRDQFMALYAKRDVETLKYAVKTNVFTLMHGIARNQVDVDGVGGDIEGVKFVVNTHPYALEPEEVEAFRNVIELCSLDTFPVEMVNIKDEDLTPKFCKNEYAMMVRYHWGYWIDMHAAEFEKETQMPGLTLIAPATFEKRPDLDKLKAEGSMHPFQALELSCASFIGLRLMPVSMFSIDDGIKGRLTPTPDATDAKSDQSFSASGSTDTTDGRPAANSS